MWDDLKEKDAQDMAVSVGLCNPDGVPIPSMPIPTQYQNMYHKLKEIFGKNTNDAMTAYGDAKCISMIFVKRMLEDSRCEAFMNDVAIHYLSYKARLAGLKPPYFWHSSKRCPIDFSVIGDFISTIYDKGDRSLARQLAIYVGSKISNDYFVEGEVFTNDK